jgi:hypothetical protein
VTPYTSTASLLITSPLFTVLITGSPAGAEDVGRGIPATRVVLSLVGVGGALVEGGSCTRGVGGVGAEVGAGDPTGPTVAGDVLDVTISRPAGTV